MQTAPPPTHVHSGMESMIRSQKEAIAELEGKIQANLDEITKARLDILFVCFVLPASSVTCTLYMHSSQKMIVA